AAIHRALRVIVIKDERKLLCLVVSRRQVALRRRRVWGETLARIVHPANYVIVVRFFTDTRKIRGEVSANDLIAHVDRRSVDRMTSEATESLEQFFAVRRVALRLSSHLHIERGLPNECGDSLDLIIV